MVGHSEKPVAAATMAAFSTTIALASLRRPSPSRMTATRPGAPRSLMIEVATASVGLSTAPIATPQAKPRSGISHANSAPSASAVTITSRIDSALIAPKSRRKLTIGTAAAAA
jgi:hypothetical protein